MTHSTITTKWHRTISVPSVRHLLVHGYGVEDIAIRLHSQPDTVRAVVADLRAKGVLSRMWAARKPGCAA